MKEFEKGLWQEEINVSNFIKTNYKEYLGDDSFLSEPSKKTNTIWNKCLKLLEEETKKGVLDIEVDKISGITNFLPGYIDKENEVIVGLQTDKPLKRIVNLYGGFRMAEVALKAYGYSLNKDIVNHFKEYRKTHNDGVFDVYTEEIKKARRAGLITGLPDAYGRGRIIGDYRRVSLYGIDKLVTEKTNDLNNLSGLMSDEVIRTRENISEQIKALNDIKEMALSYGIDISKPATNSKEAVQWLYFAYLAVCKENNGAATSLGRVSTFLDIYIERDLEEGLITEEEAQELIDQFVIKLRLIRHLRTPEYDELFAGDPTWVTESIGGMCSNGNSYVTKTSYRFLHTLTNLSPAPEPNMTVLWSNGLPNSFKKYCSKMSILTGAIQYENDNLMKDMFGEDYGISCCVSAMKLGKQMQFFGARANLAKTLLYSINGGIDEITKQEVIKDIEIMKDEYLNYDTVIQSFDHLMKSVATLYVNTMNIIHYMHDKYAYEASQMALHDSEVERLMAFGVAGLSVVADSLSAIKYAKVKPIRDKDGIAIDFEIIGDYPKYGNDDDRVDAIASMVVKKFYQELKKHKLYRNAKHTLSILTITSNVVYGEKTGATPDGRGCGVPFAPGANPMHQRDSCGALASLNSVSKIDYRCSCQDGVSNTFSIIPQSLGKNLDEQANNLSSLLDGYILQEGHHLNVNVLNRELLIEAMENPSKYPLLTIRVSGYAVHFNSLTRSQQEEVISRTFHSKM